MEMVRLCKAGTGSSGYHPRSWLPSYRVGWSAALQAAALAPSSSAQRSDQSCRRSWPESRCVPSFGKGRCAYYFFMTFQLEFLKQFKGGWHFKDTCWMDYGPPIHLCGMFSSPANPSVSKNIPPLFQSANGNPLDFSLGKRKDRSSNPWDAGAAAKSAMDMLDGLEALSTITMKIHPTKLLFSTRSKMPIFFYCEHSPISSKMFQAKNKRRIDLPGMHWTGHHDLGLLSFLLCDLRAYGELPLPESLTAAVPCKNNEDPSQPFQKGRQGQNTHRNVTEP